MVYCGSGSGSAAELEKIPGIDRKLCRELKNIRHSLRQSSGEFSSFNGLFADRKYTLHPPFVQKISELFEGKIELVDFSRPRACADKINRIVRQESRSRFDRVFSERSFAGEPVLLLLNVLYFKGAWGKPFRMYNTRREMFTTSSGKKIPVRMMNDTRHLPYYNDGTIHGIALPYRDDRFQLLVLTTVSQESSLEEVTSFLKKNGTEHMLKHSSAEYKTVIKLPKLKLSGDFDLRRSFRSAGMKHLFDPAVGDLTGMVQERALFISQARQLVKLDLDENGTEVAAATYAIAEATAFRPEIPVKYNYFYADRPFVLVLFDSRTRAILLTAAVTRP